MKINSSRLGKVEKVDIKKSIFAQEACSGESLVPDERLSSSDCVSVASEGHHVSHVLTFYSYIAYNAVRGNGVRQHLLKRVIHHLAALHVKSA